jgi:hypothetical protein
MEGDDMVRRALVVTLLVSLLCAGGVAGHSWIRIGQVSGSLGWSGDYDVWRIVTLSEGVQYKFECTMPYSADFDLKLFFDLYDDNRYVDEDWFSSYAGERVASATGTGRPEVLNITPWFTQDYGWHYVIKVYSYYGYGSYTLTNYRWGH